MASTSTTSSDQSLNDHVETFIEFLLDTETTSEESFSQAVLEKKDLYHERYQSSFEKVVKQKLQQWKDYYQKENLLANRIATDAEDEVLHNESKEEGPSSNSEEVSADSEEDYFFGNDEDYFSDNEKEQTTWQSTSRKKEKISQPIKQPDIYIDPVNQCRRLLQLLYHCQQEYTHFINLYFDTLDYCAKNNDERIGAVGLQQIAMHLSDDNTDCERLEKCLPSNSSAPNIPQTYKSVLSTIETLLSVEPNITITTLVNDLDILYPSTTRFLDQRREFRDSAHYFIDGDSLILSVAHHINVDLVSYYGNTLHVIFVIERILLTLYNQADQCNYSLLFFDCHYQYYEQEKSILSLIRACLITHLSRNTREQGSPKVQQFSSWLDKDYITFALEQKPHFIFYHDMSSFDIQNDHLLSENALNKLLCIYRLFGNYHQYYLQCHLYLMNKLILTDNAVKCFSVKFMKKCPKKSLEKIIGIVPTYRNTSTVAPDDWLDFEKKIYEETYQDDVRLLIYLKTLITCIEEKELFKLLSPLLVLHVALLIRLSLIARHLPSSFPSIEFSSTFAELIVQFQRRLALNISLANSSDLSGFKIADLFDGRLFAFTIYQLKHSSSPMYFDSDTTNIVKSCLTILKLSNSETSFRDSVEQLFQLKHITILSSSSVEEVRSSTQQEMTRISNKFIDVLVKPVLSAIDQNTVRFVDPEDKQLFKYEGKHHWHVYKEVTSEIDRIRKDDEDNKRKSTKNHHYRTTNRQLFYTYFNLYGKSLTSRDVQDNQLQIFLPISPAPAPVNEKPIRASSGSRDRRRGRSQSTSKVEEIKNANKGRIQKRRIEEENNKIANVERILNQIPSDDYARAIETIDQSLRGFKISTSRIQLLSRKIHFQKKYLQKLRKPDNFTNEKSKLELLQIDYFATMSEIVHLKQITNPLSKKRNSMEDLVSGSSSDTEKWYRFQLEKINSRLPRRKQGVPDDRVPSFIPDKWQVDFLDAVDGKQSVIIVAPTASGKTYASYYAMETALRDPDGICVYVAPSKALVNQVAATIYSTIETNVGIFTRDYRRNMDNCRILVTVPQCMEILLLSPNHQNWCKRIKYAIFDEIHCMSGEEGSDVWEKIMLLINCPMIGLSATVNNGEELRQWIQHVEDQRSKLFRTPNPRQVRFINHHERTADLNKYLYSNRELHPIHPVGVMNSKQLISRGVPTDFSLSPCETLQLSDAIATVAQGNSIPTLAEHFARAWIVERSRCNEYSKTVRDQFQKVIETKNEPAIDSIVASLKSNTSYPEPKPMLALTKDFILTLKEKNFLPCIIFSDSRNLCEQMAGSIVEYLIETEKHSRETTLKKRIDELKKKKELFEKTRKKNKSKEGKKFSGKWYDDENPFESEMMEEEETNLGLSDLEQQLLDGILDEGTLANRRGCDQKLVDALLERASTTNQRLVKYMERGVAYHHAGVNSKGRVAVEALFRNRYVQVVFSTSTLALGIHMPTKTVAFVKDSIYLDALQYRQSSGRAGRRGFDVQGHVVFVDIPLPKIRHLMISAIPNIHPHFPTSVTFFMRLLHLCSNTKDSEDAINRSLIALECPFLGQAPMKEKLIDIQTRFHCLFTLEFLYRLNLINGKGDLIGLAGLLTHLYYFEPANILLVYLMNTKLFDLVKDPTEIVTILAYLFTNMPWSTAYHKHVNLSEYRKNSKFNSQLFLSAIPSLCRERVEAYNSIVKEVYGCYIENVTRYLRSIDKGQEEKLPFSNVPFAQNNSGYTDGSFEYNLYHHQSQQNRNPSISPFAALSGLTHQGFMSNYNPTIGSWDLVYDLDLSPQVIPFVDIDCRDHTNKGYYLNSYVLDFFKHGSEKLLIMENELNSGDTYNLLLDFRLALSSIKTSLEAIVENERKQGQSNDLNVFLGLFQSMSSVESVFSKNFKRQYPSRNQL